MKVLLENEVVQQTLVEITKHPEYDTELDDVGTLKNVITEVEEFLNSGENELRIDLNLWEGVFEALDKIMEEYGLDYSNDMNWEDKENGIIVYKQ